MFIRIATGLGATCGAMRQVGLLSDGLLHIGHQVEIMDVSYDPYAGAEFDALILYGVNPIFKWHLAKEYSNAIPVWDISIGDAQYSLWLQNSTRAKAKQYGQMITGMIVKAGCEAEKAMSFFAPKRVEVVRHCVAPSIWRQEYEFRSGSLSLGWAGRPGDIKTVEWCLKNGIGICAGLSNIDLEHFYRGLDVLVMPKVHLCGSNASYEAMARGIAVAHWPGKGNDEQSCGLPLDTFGNIDELRRMRRSELAAIGNRGREITAKMTPELQALAVANILEGAK